MPSLPGCRLGHLLNTICSAFRKLLKLQSLGLTEAVMIKSPFFNPFNQKPVRHSLKLTHTCRWKGASAPTNS